MTRKSLPDGDEESFAAALIKLIEWWSSADGPGMAADELIDALDDAIARYRKWLVTP